MGQLVDKIKQAHVRFQPRLCQVCERLVAANRSGGAVNSFEGCESTSSKTARRKGEKQRRDGNAPLTGRESAMVGSTLSEMLYSVCRFHFVVAVRVILYCHTSSVNINESSGSEFHEGLSWIKDQRCFQQPWICFALTMMILSLGATKEAQFLYQKSKESNSQSWLFQSRWPGRPLDVLDATLSRASGVDHEPQ